MTDKEYAWYTEYMGGHRTATAAEKMKKDHEFVIRHAVKGMLQKENRVARLQIKRLKIYAGTDHPHVAQINGFAPGAQPTVK